MERESGVVWNDNDVIDNAVAAQNRKAYEKGLFNPFSFLTWKNAPWGPNAKNMADSVGDSRVRALGPYGVNNPTNENYQSQYQGADLGGVRRSAAWDLHGNRAIANYQSQTAGMGSARPDAYNVRAAEPISAARWNNGLERFRGRNGDANNQLIFGVNDGNVLNFNPPVNNAGGGGGN